jgi:hypothetical protein
LLSGAIVISNPDESGSRTVFAGFEEPAMPLDSVNARLFAGFGEPTRTLDKSIGALSRTGEICSAGEFRSAKLFDGFDEAERPFDRVNVGVFEGFDEAERPFDGAKAALFTGFDEGLNVGVIGQVKWSQRLVSVTAEQN